MPTHLINEYLDTPISPSEFAAVCDMIDHKLHEAYRRGESTYWRDVVLLGAQYTMALRQETCKTVGDVLAQNALLQAQNEIMRSMLATGSQAAI